MDVLLYAGSFIYIWRIVDKDKRRQIISTLDDKLVSGHVNNMGTYLFHQFIFYLKIFF